MATELAKAYVQIIPSAEGISGRLSQIMGGEASSAGNSAGAALGGNLIGKLKGLIAAAGVGKLLTDTITQGSDLQQSIHCQQRYNAEKRHRYAQRHRQRHPYTYLYEYSSSETGTVAVTGLTIPSYCKIHIFGPAVNPVWSLYQNGTLVSKGRCTITLDTGYKLVIDSDPVSMELAEYTIDNRFVSDEYQHSDFATERFITLPAGDSELRFTQDDLTVLNAYVEVKKRV